MALIGTGIAILAAVWAIALAASVALSLFGRPLSIVGPVAVVTLAAVLTAVLWFGRLSAKTRNDSPSAAAAAAVVNDYSAIGRFAIVIVEAIALLGGLGVLFVFHVGQNRRAARLKSAWQLEM